MQVTTQIHDYPRHTIAVPCMVCGVMPGEACRNKRARRVPLLRPHESRDGPSRFGWLRYHPNISATVGGKRITRVSALTIIARIILWNKGERCECRR